MSNETTTAILFPGTQTTGYFAGMERHLVGAREQVTAMVEAGAIANALNVVDSALAVIDAMMAYRTPAGTLATHTKPGRLTMARYFEFVAWCDENIPC